MHFRYEARLSFDGMVTDHHFRFRCLPMETERQKPRRLEYGTDPAVPLRERTDGFGNRFIAGEALGPHDHLNVWVSGTVETRLPGPLPAPEGAEGAPGGEREGGTVPARCLLYAVPTDLTGPGANLTAFYGRCLRGFREERARAEDLPEFLMGELYRNFSYVPGVTHVGTGAEEAWTGGKGVCQDYAQILIALCRMAGCPARYAAGFLPGEGATHAWAEVWRAGRWTGLDPTHNRRTDDRYIKLSHGRDFADCSVERGCFRGGAGQRQEIHIKVEEESV